MGKIDMPRGRPGRAALAVAWRASNAAAGGEDPPEGREEELGLLVPLV